MPANATIMVQGMTCGGCTQKVEKALLATPGVIEAHVQLTPPTASVTFDEQATPIPKIMQAINGTGFRASGFTIRPTA